MSTSNEIIELLETQFAQERRDGARAVSIHITTVLSIRSTKSLTAVATLEVDGHELLPSARVHLEEGENRQELPSVSINFLNNQLSTMKNKEKHYDMKLKLAVVEQDPLIHTQTLVINL